MAYIRKTPGGRIRVEIELRGVRESKTFDTLKEAKAWARAREKEIAAGRGSLATLGQVLDEYVERVSTHKEGGRKEELRLVWPSSAIFQSLPLDAFKTSTPPIWRDGETLDSKLCPEVRCRGT